MARQNGYNKPSSSNSFQEEELKIKLPLNNQLTTSKLTSSRFYISILFILTLLTLNLVSNVLLYFQPKTSSLSLSKHLKIGTWNVRYDSNSAAYEEGISKIRKRDWSSGYGEFPWIERRTKLVDSVVWNDLDVVGFQEVLVNQLTDLKGLMGEGYDHVGVGRDDGKKKGEFVPIFYKK